MNIESSHFPDAEGPGKLIRMAQEIARYFCSYPDEKAAAAIAEHINHFWTPKMREEFLAALDEPGRQAAPLLLATRGLIKRRKTEISNNDITIY